MKFPSHHNFLSIMLCVGGGGTLREYARTLIPWGSLLRLHRQPFLLKI